VTAALVRLRAPDGAESFLCYDCPGHTPDAARATRFATDAVAWRAARAAVYGNPDAFWDSERRNAELTRQRMAGYVASVETAPI
jgi:hypothetical protein